MTNALHFTHPACTAVALNYSCKDAAGAEIRQGFFTAKAQRTQRKTRLEYNLIVIPTKAGIHEHGIPILNWSIKRSVVCRDTCGDWVRMGLP
jgi:hypothetical protein